MCAERTLEQGQDRAREINRNAIGNALGNAVGMRSEIRSEVRSERGRNAVGIAIGNAVGNAMSVGEHKRGAVCYTDERALALDANTRRGGNETGHGTQWNVRTRD